MPVGGEWEGRKLHHPEHLLPWPFKICVLFSRVFHRLMCYCTFIHECNHFNGVPRNRLSMDLKHLPCTLYPLCHSKMVFCKVYGILQIGQSACIKSGICISSEHAENCIKLNFIRMLLGTVKHFHSYWQHLTQILHGTALRLGKEMLLLVNCLYPFHVGICSLYFESLSAVYTV